MNSYNKQLITNQLKQQSPDFSRIDILIRQAPIAVITSLLLGYLITPLLWAHLSHSFLLVWLSCHSVIALSRLVSVRYIKQKISDESIYHDSSQLRNYEYMCAAGAFCSGLAFGSLGFFFSSTWPLLVQFIIPFMIAGLTAGAIASNVSSTLNYQSFIFPALLPLSYGLYSVGMPSAALLILVYLVIMIVLMERVNKLFLDGLELKVDNLGLVGTLTEHNEELRFLLEKLHKSEQLSSSAFNKAGVTMMLVDKTLTIFKVNDEACLLLGYDEQELIGLSILDFLFEDEKAQCREAFSELIAGSRPQYQIRKRYIRSNNIDVWVQEVVSSVTDEKGQFEYAIIHAQDVTQEYRLTKKLSYQANHDVLTGLLNRYAFETRMQRLFLEDDDMFSQKLDEHVLCYIDLDQFKVVNDTFGHSIADDLLRKLAALFKRTLRKSDLLARLGGDEFALLMFNCSIEAASKQLEHVLNELRAFSFEHGQYKVTTTASIGLVSFDKINSMTEVLKQADSACYAAKDAGRDRLHVYRQDDAFLTQRTGEMSWVAKIQQAIDEENFILYSQEIVQIEAGSVLPHYELLIRMKDSDGNIIPPGLFLPAAENYGLASAIDLWVVDHVINTLKKAQSAGKNIAGVYGVNLSGHSLGDKRLYEEIIQRIKNNDLMEADVTICFEITETAAISNMNVALYFINELRAVGCQFALDDFGSGLSSYAYLQQMPIDYLKIDGMFVKDCLNDAVKLEMIKSINSVGHVMGLKTIAEFVENDQIFDKLGEIDVDYAQGYWNGPPQPWLIAS